MKKLWLKHKDWFIHEVGAWVTTIITFATADGVDILIALYNGDFSDATMMGLRYLIIRSIVKAILIKLLPELFPLYQKNVGILPAKKIVAEARDEV